MRRPFIPFFVAATLATGGLAACSTSTPTIAIGLNAGGCDAAVIALPTGKVNLEVTNRGGGGEFEIVDETDHAFAKENVDQDETKTIPVNLKTGTYIAECRTDDLTATVIAGTPTGAKGEPGAPVAFRAAAAGYTTADGNSYDAHNLVANSAAYDPDIVDPAMVNAWGLANRPAGLGGHIWVAASNSGQSIEYVGDIGEVPLYQDELRSISIPGAAARRARPSRRAPSARPRASCSTVRPTSLSLPKVALPVRPSSSSSVPKEPSPPGPNARTLTAAPTARRTHRSWPTPANAARRISASP